MGNSKDGFTLESKRLWFLQKKSGSRRRLGRGKKNEQKPKERGGGCGRVSLPGQWLKRKEKKKNGKKEHSL